MGVLGEVEGLVGVTWMCSASTEVAGVHGATMEVLLVSMMAAGAPACSGQKERVGELDLGQVSMAGQENRRKGECVEAVGHSTFFSFSWAAQYTARSGLCVCGLGCVCMLWVEEESKEWRDASWGSVCSLGLFWTRWR